MKEIITIQLLQKDDFNAMRGTTSAEKSLSGNLQKLGMTASKNLVISYGGIVKGFLIHTICESIEYAESIGSCQFCKPYLLIEGIRKEDVTRKLPPYLKKKLDKLFQIVDLNYLLSEYSRDTGE